MPFVNTFPQTDPAPKDSEEITRTRVSLATGFFHLTLTSSAWLANLTPHEFEQLYREILPALDQEHKRRSALMNQPPITETPRSFLPIHVIRVKIPP